ncbi:MAG: methylated-DNA--[protein]-cysteine S-methyltransferase [Armatimonadota bacterium]|jgi:methylated-DNA-[protein]-cysteine S-methyltransferase
MAIEAAVQHRVFRVPPGWMAAEATATGICRLPLPVRTRAEAKKRLSADSTPAPAHHPILARAEPELRAYFAGSRAGFSAPVDLSAMSPFRRRVLEALMRVPYGATESYAGLAAAAGSPRAARAVGQAMANNPVPIIVPCHRVIGADGSLTGFGGGLPWKRALLALEQGDPSALLGLAGAAT